MATINDILDWLNQGAQGDIPGTGGSEPNVPQASQGAGVPQAQMAGDVLGWRGSEGDQSSVPNAGAPGGPMGPWMRGQGMDPAMKGYDWGGVPTQRPWLMSPQTPANEASDEQPGATPVSEQKGYQAGQKAGQGLWAMLFGKQPQKTPGDYSGGIPPHLLDHYNALVQSGLPPNVAHSILTQPSTGEGDTSLEQALHTWPYPYAGAQQEYQSAQQSPPSYQELWGQLQNKSLNEQMNLPTYEQDTPGDDDNLGFTRLPSGQYVPWGWGGQ